MMEQEWQYVLNMMPSDLQESATSKLALRRRREITSAGDLLRLALAYGLCDFSLRQTAAWAELMGVGHLSDVAVMKRLQGASEWLGYLILQWLQQRGLTAGVPPMAVRVIDATVICEPGSQGTDWRLHLGLDLAKQRISTVELTGPQEGETFLRHTVAPGQILLGDRGYAQRAGVASVLGQQGHVAVRINWQNFPLQSRAGARLDILRCLETLGPGEIGDWPVQFQAAGGVYPVRLIALRKSQAATEQQQRKIRREAKRKGRRPDRRSLRAAHFVHLITDLPAAMLPAHEALELYRLRWQIEMAFKRLKGLLHIDHLRAKDSALAATYLYAKILGALILDELCQQALCFSPWGFPLLPQAGQPLAPAAYAV